MVLTQGANGVRSSRFFPVRVQQIRYDGFRRRPAPGATSRQGLHALAGLSNFDSVPLSAKAPKGADDPKGLEGDCGADLIALPERASHLP